MRLQKEDLENYALFLKNRTKWNFEIIVKKWFSGYDILIKQTKTGKEIPLTCWNIRECFEYLRAFYRGLDYSKILDIKK